jgi:hypothetical protein
MQNSDFIFPSQFNPQVLFSTHILNYYYLLQISLTKLQTSESFIIVLQISAWT